MNYEIIVQPTEEPITLEEAKLHLKVDNIDEDMYISALIVAAREQVEQFTGRALLSQTVEQKLHCFPDKGSKNLMGGIRLYKNRIQSISSIKYTDTEGAQQTWDSTNYMFVNTEPAYVLPLYNVSFPQTRGANNIIIQYVAGWATAAAVPISIKQAMLLLIGDFYENRQDSKRTLPSASQRLLEPYRTHIF